MTHLDDALPDGRVDAAALREVYGRFPTGVMGVCAMHDGDPIGFAASSFNTVSMDPPMVVISVQSSSGSWPLLEASPTLGLSVFSTEQEWLCRQLASHGGFDRFSGADWTATEGGAVLIDGAAAWLECRVHDSSTVGDHELVILEVLRHRVNPDADPLVFHDSGFHSLARTMEESTQGPRAHTA